MKPKGSSKSAFKPGIWIFVLIALAVPTFCNISRATIITSDAPQITPDLPNNHVQLRDTPVHPVASVTWLADSGDDDYRRGEAFGSGLVWVIGIGVLVGLAVRHYLKQ